MKISNNVKRLITICLAIFSAIFINISLSKKLSLLESIKGNSITPILLTFAFYQLLAKANKIKDKRMSIIAFVLAISLATFEIIGHSINTYLNLSGILHSKTTIIKSLMKFISLTITLYSIIKIIYSYILSYNCNIHKEKIRKFFTNNKRSLFFIWGFIILCWTPYLLRFFPANITPDSMSQIMQGLGLINLTNHHPIFHTGIISIAMNIGKTLGNYNIGGAIYSIVQMIIMSGIFAYTIYYMSKKNINIMIRLLTFIFYAIYPVHALYSMTMWKDILFGGVMLLFTINLCELVTNSENYFKSKKNIMLLILNMIFVFLFRNNGIYVIILLLPFTIILLRKYYKKLLVAFSIVILLYIAINGPIFKLFNIQKGSTREALSIPLQQFARVTRDHKNTLTEEEKNSIYKFLPVENLDELYYEKISDNVKSHFNDEAFTNNKLEFIKLWIRLGIKYPRTYIESFLCNSYGYWYPEALHWVVSKEVYQSNNEIESKLQLKQSPIIKNSLIDKLAESTINRKIPVICMIYSVGFTFWIFLTMLGYNVYKKEYKKCLIYLPILFLWLTCLASPVYCEFRYIYSLFTCIPLLIGINFTNKMNIDNEE